MSDETFEEAAASGGWPQTADAVARRGARARVVPEIGSTNDAVRDAAAAHPSDWPTFSVLAALSQTAGRGRLGRVWTAPPGKTLAASTVVRPAGALGEVGTGWLPLLAGVAVARAVRAVMPPGTDVQVKWPNDVLVDSRKVSGILCELMADGTSVIIGTGINLVLAADELPTDRSTSLLLAGATDTSADGVLSRFITGFIDLYDDLVRSGGDAVASGLRTTVIAECGTLGRSVTIELPDGTTTVGVARTIDGTGRLVVDVDGVERIVAVGDVTHLRH